MASAADLIFHLERSYSLASSGDTREPPPPPFSFIQLELDSGGKATSTDLCMLYSIDLESRIRCDFPESGLENVRKIIGRRIIGGTFLRETFILWLMRNKKVMLTQH